MDKKQPTMNPTVEKQSDAMGGAAPTMNPLDGTDRGMFSDQAKAAWKKTGMKTPKDGNGEYK